MKAHNNFKKISAVLLTLIIVILCVAASYSKTNTFVIYDEGEKIVYNSSFSNTSDFLADINFNLPEEKYLEMPEYTENGFAKINLLRKNSLTLKVDGMEITAYALKDETISDVLSNKGITLGAKDVISHPVNSPADDGLYVEIKRILTKNAEETVEIPFETEQRKNASMNKGTSKVIQKGVPGVKRIAYNIKTENGVEIERTVVSETVVKKPVKKIVEIGTYDPNQSGTLTLPNGQKLEYKKVMNMTATAYTTERTSDKITATGKVAKVGFVAVDCRVIPLGSRLYICSPDGKKWVYGIAVAEDTGVRGNKIDLFFNTHHECISFGRRKAKVYVLK